MYAVVRSGGKQHRVVEGERLRVDRLAAEVGSEIALEDVLMVGGDGEARLGTPHVDGARVSAKVVRQDRGEKIRVFKKRRRKGSKRMMGFRRAFTELQITEIKA